MQKELFNITGMTCSACSNKVTKAVSSLDGIADVTVNLLKNTMTVNFDEGAVSVSDMANAVSKAGYRAKRSLWWVTASMTPRHWPVRTWA